MKESFRKLKNRIKTLEERVDAKEKALSELQAARMMPGVGTPAVQAAGELCNGLPLVHHREAVSHLPPESVQEAFRVLAFWIFTAEELKMSSISGKRSAKCGDSAPRPPLDQDRLRQLEALVREKCPSLTHKGFIENLQNLQKVTQRGRKPTDSA